jgi:hypothetical protein
MLIHSKIKRVQINPLESKEIFLRKGVVNVGSKG